MSAENTLPQLLKKQPPPLWSDDEKRVPHGSEAHSLRKLPIFSSFKLKKDSKGGNYPAFNEVVYPKADRLVSKQFRKAELDSLWLAGFLDQACRLKTGNLELTNAPGEQGQAGLSDALDGEEAFKNNKHIPAITNTSIALKLSHVAYGTHQRKKAARQRGLRTELDMKSLDLDALQELFRLEHECAYKIQRAYGRWIVWKRWHLGWEQYKASRRIQACMRGTLIRRRTAEWFSKRETIIKNLQARVRGHITVNHWKQRYSEEVSGAKKIQAAVRMFLGRRKHLKRKRHLAAVCLQQFWRGVCGRSQGDMLWLNCKAIKIETVTRQFLAQKYYHRRRRAALTAANKIQSCFRGFNSRRIRNRLLNEREKLCRRYNTLLLASEEEWLQSKLNSTMNRMGQTKIRERWQSLSDTFGKGAKEVREREREYLAFQKKKRMISPREFAAGWDKQYMEGIKEYRHLVTQGKLHVLLKVAMEYRKIYEELTLKNEVLLEMETQSRYLAKWRDEENLDMLEQSKKERFDAEHEYKVRKIAEQRRKWGVRFYMQSGKPDKRRPIGRPWDPEVYAKPDRDIFCGGDVNLLAFDQDPRFLPEGSDASLKITFEKMSLQCFLNEVQRTESLLEPLARAMKHSLPSESYSPNEELSQAWSGLPLSKHMRSFVAKEENIDKAVDGIHLMTGVSQDTNESSALTQQYRKEVGVHNSGISAAEESSMDSESESSSVSFSLEPSTFRTSAGRPPFGFHSIHSNRITTTSSFWPFKEAEDRVKPTYEESFICSRLLKKYKNRVSGRFEPSTGRVPWNLINELQVEKLRWKTEKSKMQEHIVDRIMKGHKSPSILGRKAATGAANQEPEEWLSKSEEV